VLVNMADRSIKSGEVYAIAVEDELRVKRLVRRTDGSLEVKSDNPSPQYPTEILEGTRIERLNVIGRVVWRGG
ncbi:MAG: cI, partial [Nevskia sp.]|nr:cI [Nevskia sp.]